MTNKLTVIATLATAAFFITGCAGPEQKLGRGIRNATEFARLGDVQRSIEHTALWDSPSQTYTTGVIRGLNRSLARTAYGVYDIVTFPFPGYEAKYTPKGYIAPDHSVATTKYPYGGLRLPENPTGPTGAPTGLPSDPIMDSSGELGLGGGPVGRSIPGNRFNVFNIGK
ncbi:MAG: exosortase system-associated protein, TIGR04073 family [Verrucomicrobia bacterium]|nr:exosortase system-associated protein, TIGR04073 family [Verrucomicrobiota bacterium]